MNIPGGKVWEVAEFSREGLLSHQSVVGIGQLDSFLECIGVEAPNLKAVVFCVSTSTVKSGAKLEDILIEDVNINSSDIEMGFMQKNETVETSGSVIVGLFDTITGLTKGVGGLFGQFEHGFESIRPENYTLEEESNMTSSSSNKNRTHGSNFIVGLFDSLKDLTKDVTKLVGGVEEELNNRRPDVLKLANHVKGEVQDLGSALKNWVESLDDNERNITLSVNHTMPDGKVVQVANYTSWFKISSVEDHEEEKVPLVEEIPIID